MCKFGNKILIMFCAALPLLLTTSCAPSLAGRVKEFQKAANSGDVEKSLSFYADDVRFEIVGTPMVIEGKENLRKPIEEHFILNGRLTFTDTKVKGNTATYKVREQNDWLKAAGIDALDYEYDQIIFENGLIKKEIAKPTQKSMEIMGEFQETFEKWATEKHGQEWAKLKSEGITRENVGRWLVIIRQWRERLPNDRE
ncbi:MAG: nuclear transport factor 2 family protein [Phycisphaerae bacterium]|nr:nuclear transport factor 2 family protein [Phycisphaerae bacterium]MDD5381151.1 nuclear transport factor 2 family protein [Phycisphaerae bacterium]